MIRGVLFDMDGVLVNNTQAHVKAFEIFCERYGVEDWQHKLQTAFGMGNDDIMRLILPEEIIREKGMKALGEEKEAIYREVYAPEIRPVRGLVELLEELRRRGIRCAVGSSGCRENVDFVLSNCGITDYFSCIVSGASAMEPKLRELGIPYAYMGEYLEQSPLGKAEWLVAVAEIAGMRERGEEVFREIPLRYDSLKTLAAKAEQKPVVMLNTPYGDSWLMAPPSSYVARLIADAGGQYVYTQDTGNQSRPIDTEEAYRLAEMSDCWINVGSAASLRELAEIVPKFMDTRPVREGRVYNNNRRTNPSGGNDYWESGVIHPDLILQDLIRIFHPELTDAEPTYYRKLN